MQTWTITTPAPRRAWLAGAAAVALCAAMPSALAQKRAFSFAYDQPPTTAYGIAANIFDAKLKELSGGNFSINQFPGAQLGQEPQMLQKMRAGDIDFVITSTANASTLAPQAGVFSLHFLFRDQNHLTKVLADPAVTAEFRDMVKDSVQGAQVLGLLTMGLRNMYSKKEVKTVDDVKGQKVRVQATKTEDTHFPAYGAQTVHMPFGEVYVAADRRGQHRRKRRQRLPRQQALRGGAGAVDDRARGQQQLHLGQRQDLEQPDPRSSSNGCRRRPPR